MRILHILKDVQNVGNGVTNAAVDLACVQAELGHHVAIASAGGSFEEFLRSNGVGTYKLDQVRGTRAFSSSLLHLNRIVSQFKPEIVHCHLAPGMILARALRFVRRYSTVAHIHNVQERRSLVMRLADAVIPVSSAVAEDMVKLGIPRRKLFVVQNRFVGSPRRATAGENARKLMQPAIVSVAGMNKRKNIDGLIDAFNMIAQDFPEAHLYLVGDGGSGRVEFEAHAAQSAAANRIHFEGFQSDPQAYMRSAYIFVLASHRDSSPLVLHEAREAGAAIIATDVDGIPEALDHGQAGILFPPGDTAALANCMRRLLENPAEQAEWKARALDGIAKHTTRRMTEEVLSVYETVLGGSRTNLSKPLVEAES